MIKVRNVQYMLFGWLASAFLGPSVGFANNGLNICRDPKALSFFMDSSKYRALSQLPALENRQIVIIGERHETMPGLRGSILRQLVQNAKNLSGKICLFYELSAKKTIEQEIERFQNSTSYGEVLRRFNELHQNSKKLALNEILIDYDFKNEYEDVPMNHRDQVMAKNILRSFSEGNCEQGILFVGEEHASSGEAGRVTLPRILKGQSLKVSTMMMLNASESYINEVPPEERESYKLNLSWQGLCQKKQNLPLPREVQVLNLSTVSKNWAISPFNKDSGRWSDFEWLILTNFKKSFQY